MSTLTGSEELNLAAQPQALEFRLLGPMTVRCDGRVVRIAAAKQRVVLAALLLGAGRLVPLDELAEAVWGGEPPATARVTLQNYVKRLRTTLAGVSRGRILTRPQGYQMNVADHELDVSQFEALYREARHAAQRRSWQQAATLLRGALGLWAGEPLTDVPSELLLLRDRPRLQEIHAQAVEARIDADLHLGAHRAVIPELRQLTAIHPLRERLHAMLMLALYRDGRQADALAAYRQARGTLVRELGVEPGPELYDLHQQILAADPMLMQVHQQAPVQAPAATGRDWATPRQLPAGIRHFAGRKAELATLYGLLDEDAGEGTLLILAIGGTAGVGKTALAVYWAHQVADRFPDGQLYVNLRGFDPSGQPVSAAEAVRGLLAALGATPDRIPHDVAAQAGLYRSLMAGRRMLILLDNARNTDHVRPLLPAGPHCVVLITSRRQLTALAAAEGAHLITLDALSAAEAHHMLIHRLGSSRVAAEPEAEAEVTRLCARLPLALAIIAARGAAHPAFRLGALAAELRDAHGRLDALNAGETAANARAVFSWSYGQLTAPAARMFRLLGAHAGPDISEPAAAKLAALPAEAARRALSELTQAHLLTEHVPGRYTCHDLLRSYATEQAAVVDGEAGRHAAVRRVLAHYLHAAHAAARRFRG